MEYRNYLSYKVYENGNVENNKGLILTPQNKNNCYFYTIKNKKISAGFLILFAFGIYPKYFGQRVKHIDNDKSNNSLKNLTYERNANNHI